MVKRLRLSWVLALVFLGSDGFVVVKEVLDPMRLVDLKIDKVRYGDLPVLSYALELFVREHGWPPDEREGLAALVCSAPSDEGHCIIHLSNDPWSHPYVYRRIGRAPGYMVYSIGADGVDEGGGGDDIVTRAKEYSCSEYGVGCLHIGDRLELVAFWVAGLSGVFLLAHGVVILVVGARSWGRWV
jgi:hypothetical protein